MNMSRLVSGRISDGIQNPSAQPISFRRDIQGLRAVAVLAVILFHASKTWLPSGFVGVDVFFVISGYIITSLIIASDESFSWREFYWGRVRRIVPAYIMMLAIVSLVASFLFLNTDFSFFIKSAQSAALFYSNQYFSDFGSYFAPSAYEMPLLHTWSLAIEMQFYIVLPLFIYLTPRKVLPWVLGFICFSFFMYAEWQIKVEDNQRRVYYSLLARVPEFLVGALIAVTGVGGGWSARFSSIASWTGLILLGACFTYTDEKSFPGFASLIPCIATGLLITSRKGLVNQALSTSGFVWIGGLSYSLYLWHWPVLAFMRYYLGSYELPGLWLLVFFVITLLLSWTSFHWVEKLCRNSKRSLTKPLNLFGIVMTAVLAIVISVPLNALVEKPTPVEMTRYAAAESICHGQIVGDCLRGDRSKGSPLLVLGDSHAAQLNEFFDIVGEQGKFAARVITASNCVPIPDFDVERIPDYSRGDCRSQIATLDPYIADASVIVVAGMWQWQAPNAGFMSAFSAFLEKESQRHVRVFVLAQIPMFDTNMLRIRRFAALALPVYIRENKEWEKANRDIKALVARYDGAEFLDYSRSGFFADAPFHSGQLIYLDNHHLNELGAQGYGQFAAPLLKKYLPSTTND